MKEVFEKIYAASGLSLILLSLLNLMTGTGDIVNVYLFTCIGLFMFFDSLNYFLADQKTLISSSISLSNGLLFIVFAGVVIGFFAEIYGALLTGIWPGLFVSGETSLTSLDLLNQLLSAVFLYGILVLPSYSIYRILNQVFKAEKMLHDSIGESDFYRYFVHIGVLLVVTPFTLLFIDLGLNLSYILFLLSLVGLLMVIEYFEFRKKGQGMIANVALKDVERLGGILTVTVALGFIITFLTTRTGFWVTGNIPFYEYQLFDVPVSMVLVWTLIMWIMASGLNLISDEDFSHFKTDGDYF